MSNSKLIKEEIEMKTKAETGYKSSKVQVGDVFGFKNYVFKITKLDKQLKRISARIMSAQEIKEHIEKMEREKNFNG